MTKRVVIYARVSTNEQNCDRQVAELGGVPVIQEYITELLNAFNQLKEE